MSLIPFFIFTQDKVALFVKKTALFSGICHWPREGWFSFDWYWSMLAVLIRDIQKGFILIRQLRISVFGWGY